MQTLSKCGEKRRLSQGRSWIQRQRWDLKPEFLMTPLSDSGLCAPPGSALSPFVIHTMVAPPPNWQTTLLCNA